MNIECEMENNGNDKKAKKIIEGKIGFFAHLGVYLGINFILIVINLFYIDPGYIWAKWPLLGWGIGIILHGLNVFFFSKILSLKESTKREKIERNVQV
jgi:hypothetical protein